jgi:uncharacterized membrane protein
MRSPARHEEVDVRRRQRRYYLKAAIVVEELHGYRPLCGVGPGPTLRVVATPVTLAGMLDLAFTELSRYGYSSVSVSCRLLEAMRDLAPCLSCDEDRDALARQAAMIGERSGNVPANDADRAQLAGCYRDILNALQHAPDHRQET